MEDIIINGISLKDLERQLTSIRKEASEIISTNVELAISLSKLIVESTSKEEIQKNAVKAYDALNKAKFVSSVSGVRCDLPYNSSYSGDYDSDTISAMLEYSESETLNEVYNSIPELDKLVSLAYDMEYETKQWNASAC